MSAMIQADQQLEPTGKLAAAKPKPAKVVEFEVLAALEYLASENNRQYERAIKLYEFYVALISCVGGVSKANDGDEPGEFKINVPAWRLRDARLFVIMQLLERRVDKRRESSSKLSNEDKFMILTDVDHAHLYGKFVLEGGWRRARYMPNAKDFDAELESEWRNFSDVAPLIAFSMAADVAALPPRQRAGITMALEILPEYEFLEVKRSRATLARRWSRYAPVAIFSYIMLRQGCELRPPQVAKRRFLQDLLSMSADPERIRRTIAAYNLVREHLQARNYRDWPALEIAGVRADVALSIDPLPQEIQQAIEVYDVSGRRALFRR